MAKIEWIETPAKCPVCGKSYCYVEAFKPKTCGNRICVESDLGQKIINAENKQEVDRK